MVYWAVLNVWYSMIVNGVKEGFFTSSRGLRQGDPLSPSLFILVAEVLSVYLARVYEDVTIPRFTQPPSTPHIHHLAYADDVVARVRRATVCVHKSFPFTYLGCPVYAGRKKYIYFASVVEEVKAECLSWQRRVLSKGRKTVLMTSVLQAIPLHLFAACAPPK
nr:uncharacterized protein LOC109153875 [Ipomoea batatas]